MKTIVCIGFAEALSAPEVAWSLLDAGFEVVAFGRKGRCSALRHTSRVTVVDIASPEHATDAALKDVAGVLAQHNPVEGKRNVLLPLDDASLWLCSRLELDCGWVLAGACGAMVDLALDKGSQIRSARTAGLRVPESSIATSIVEVLDRVKDLPLVLRPAMATTLCNGRLQKGSNWMCATQAELERATSEWNGEYPLLVQPFIQGKGEGVFGLATDAGVQAWSAHRRLRMMNPHGSGSSACVSQPVTEDVRAAVERLIQQTGWRGLFMVELLRDRAGTAWFVEFNGRPWGSMALSRRQGLEYAAWAVKAVLESPEQVPAGLQGDKPVVCRNVGRELMHLLFVLRGRKSAAIKEWPSFWRTMIQVLCVRPSDSLYNWRREDWRVFFADTWYTLRNNLTKSRRG